MPRGLVLFGCRYVENSLKRNFRFFDLYQCGLLTTPVDRTVCQLSNVWDVRKFERKSADTSLQVIATPTNLPTTGFSCLRILHEGPDRRYTGC